MATGNALAMFEPANVPAHISAYTASNINEKISVPSLSYEGKNWTISINGEKQTLRRKNEDGDEVPITVMKVVILGFNEKRGRSFYEGAYDPKNVKPPDCWSDDGVTPDASIDAPKSKTCATCEFSKKGSKTSDAGKAVTACSQHRMIAVVPASDLGFTPLRMKLAVTSDWDKKNPEAEAKGWFGFSNYTDLLRQRGVTHTAKLITKMKFDMTTAYPKVLFSPGDWVSAADMPKVIELTEDESVLKLLGGTWTPAGVDGKKIVDEEEAAPATAATVATAPTAEQVAAKEAADKKAASDARKATKVAAANAAAEAAAAAAKAAAKAAADEDDEGDGTMILPGTKSPAADAAKPVNTATAASPIAAAPVTTITPGVEKMLAAWDDE